MLSPARAVELSLLLLCGEKETGADDDTQDGLISDFLRLAECVHEGVVVFSSAPSTSDHTPHPPYNCSTRQNSSCRCRVAGATVGARANKSLLLLVVVLLLLRAGPTPTTATTP